VKSIIMIVLIATAIAALVADSTFVVVPGWNLRWDGHAVKLDDGSTFIAWIDTQHGYQAIRAQRISPDGDVIWPEPIMVKSASGSRLITNLTKCPNSDVIVTWAESGVSGPGITAQKVSMAGDILWDSVGVNTLILDNPFYIRYSSDGQGGLFVCSLTNGSLSGVHLDSSGASLWGKNPLQLYTISLYWYPFLVDMVSDGCGGVILNIEASYPAFVGDRSGFFRFDYYGDPVGNLPMLIYGTLPSPIRMVEDGNGDVILHANFYDEISGICVGIDKIDVEGNPILPQPRLISMGYGGFCFYQWVLPNDVGGANLVWQHRQAGVFSLRVMALDDDFQPIWPGGFREIPGLFTEAAYIKHSLDSTGGMYIVWRERLDNVISYKAQYISGQGDVMWPEPLEMTDGLGNIRSVTPIAHHDNALIFLEKAEGPHKGLYMGRFSESGMIDADLGPQPVIEGVHRYPANLGLNATGNGFLTFWEETRDGQPTIVYQLYNHSEQAQLEPEGRLLNSGAGYNESGLLLKRMENDKIALLYTTLDDSETDTYLQVIDHLGNKLHPEQGIAIGNPGAKIGHETEDIYIGWIAGPQTQPLLMGQRISAGQKLWGESGRILATLPVGTTASMQAVEGRYFIYRLDGTQGICYALRVDQNGDVCPGWDPLGTALITSANLSYSNVYRCGMMQDKLMCFLETVSSNLITTRMQLLSPEGGRLWGEDGLSFGFEWQAFQVTDAAFGDDVTALIPGNSQIRIFKINPDGSMPFGADGLALPEANGSVSEARIRQVEDELFAIAWTSNSNLYLCYMASNGNVTDPGNTLICSGVNINHHIYLENNGPHGFLTWNDNRAGTNCSSVAAATFNLLGVENLPESSAPSPAITLLPNYPNPFNPSTTISFHLAEPTSAKLSIYNSKGQLVKTLVPSTAMSAGEHRYLWDGQDEAGRAVATGLYLCRLQAGERSQVRKMLLVK